jgi:hypothetical protein
VFEVGHDSYFLEKGTAFTAALDLFDSHVVMLFMLFMLEFALKQELINC